MIKAITNNLQVVVETIHIRFEDKGVARSRVDERQFNFGVHIE